MVKRTTGKFFFSYQVVPFFLTLYKTFVYFVLSSKVLSFEAPPKKTPEVIPYLYKKRCPLIKKYFGRGGGGVFEKQKNLRKNIKF